MAGSARSWPQDASTIRGGLAAGHGHADALEHCAVSQREEFHGQRRVRPEAGPRGPGPAVRIADPHPAAFVGYTSNAHRTLR